MNSLVRLILFLSMIASFSLLSSHEEEISTSRQLTLHCFHARQQMDLKYVASEELFEEGGFDIRQCLVLKKLIDHLSKIQHELEEFGFEVAIWEHYELEEEREDVWELPLWKRFPYQFLQIA